MVCCIPFFSLSYVDMKLLVWIFSIAMITNSFVFATNEDSQIIDTLEDQREIAQEEQLQFTTFESCEEMETTLESYIKDNFKHQRWWFWWPIRIFWEPVALEMAFDDSADMSESVSTTSTTSNARVVATPKTGWWEEWWIWSSVDFSTTNTQKIWIDEADILKSTWEYLYYYNQKEHKIHIIKSPLDIASETIDLSRLDIITNINLPKHFYWIQMYVDWDQLIIISNRSRSTYIWGFLNTWNHVDVIVYDVTSPDDPELIRFTELDGNYHDSRRIGNKLYVVNQLRMDRYRPMQNWKTIDDVDLWEIDLLPKNIDVAYTTNESKKNLQVGNQTFPYHVSKNTADCSTIHYVLPTKESIEQFWLHPSFTVVNVIDLENTDNVPDITTAFGSTNTIHMASDNLYLTDHFYLPEQSTWWGCPPNARCVMPFFWWWEHTLIHKFNIIDEWVWYQDSTLVNGAPINQYSMDQNTSWEFRILTSTRHPERATHLTILDTNLDVKWTVRDIEPGEEFKSSRYMWDKLYLVTFEQTDPLFVIDMKDSSEPKIIGELVIPWFSTYLHPYAPAINWVQYLLWLGYHTDLNEWWWTVTEWLKLDLYKIDYNTTDADWHVSVTQEYSQVWWWRWSQSEALHNPRMFVWNEAKNMLVLPMHLQDQDGGTERCEIEIDDTGEELWRECWEDGGRSITTFIGMKWITVTVDWWIQESHSFDYKELLKQDRDLYNNWRYNTRQLMPRVWYVWDALYQINWAFAHFAIINDASSEQSYLPFSSTIKIAPLPAPSTVVDEITISQCLQNKWRNLFMTEDCRYCSDQADVFGDYFSKLTVVNCDNEQSTCSEAWITWYPTWTDSEWNRHPWVRNLEDLYILAQCWLT